MKALTEEQNMASHYENHARELLNQGPDWHISSWRVLDWKELGCGAPGSRLKVTGCLAPTLPDGRVDWDNAVPKSTKSVIFTNREHDEWLSRWEEATGKCSQCAPGLPGQEWGGWNHITGTKYNTCSRCKGSGVKP